MCGIASIAVEPEHSLPDLRERLGAMARSVLDSVQSRGWLQSAAVQQVAGDLKAGKVHSSRLWALIALGAIG